MKHLCTVKRAGIVHLDGTDYAHSSLVARVGHIVRVQARKTGEVHHCHVETLTGLHVCYALPVDYDACHLTQAA